ncbi:adenylate/guanylate cyclase domain-containing protein [Methylogaea oryzae]|uniref:adenylate/guanylate cyclase domain-containing protein n=1 Tax=Methylogaea oryzae TaxID=1295382 RepID=UPI001C817A93|nr:adenylate/guanylate cyclase domain-containing protein [Methylogaea oryzae]
MARLIQRIDNAAARDGDTPQQRLSKTLLIFISVAALCIAPWGAWRFAVDGRSAAAAVAGGYALLSFAALADLLVRKADGVCRWFQATALLVVPAALQYYAGGFSGSGALVLWSFLSPVCVLVFAGPRAAELWYGAFCIAVFGAGALDLAAGADADGVLWYVENVSLVTCIAFIAMRYLTIEREKARQALEAEHQLLRREQARSEALLLNILPAPIAERLKASERSIADGFAEATILFSDIVGFTQLAAHTPPAELVAMLNRLFSAFDQVAERYGVEKIKTIGDAYMACAGLPQPRADHAEAVAEVAFGMLQAVDAYNREYGTGLSIRIGINSGPVVAGVIGLKKFIYDLWGDTVNVASRMESHGTPGRIHISAATMRLLEPHYLCEAREPMDVKGIGRVQTGFLIGRKPPG